MPAYLPAPLTEFSAFNKTVNGWMPFSFLLHCMRKKESHLMWQMKSRPAHLRWGCCRWCRSPPTEAGLGSPRRRSTDTPACTARFWRPPPEWRPSACCRLSLSVLWSQSHNIYPGSCSRSRWTPGRKTKDTNHIHYL